MARDIPGRGEQTLGQGQGLAQGPLDDGKPAKL